MEDDEDIFTTEVQGRLSVPTAWPVCLVVGDRTKWAQRRARVAHRLDFWPLNLGEKSRSYH